MSEDIERKVKEMLARLTGFYPEEIGLDKKIVEDLGIDSLKVIEIATEIEKTYKVKVKDMDIMELGTVREAVEFIQGLLVKKTEKGK